MKKSIISKIQWITSLAVAVLIAIFAFFPLLSVSVESTEKVYESSFDTVITTAMQKEMQAIEENDELSMEQKQEKAKAIYERYGELAYDIMGCKYDENGEKINLGDKEISLSGINIITSIPDTIKFLTYYFKSIAIDMASDVTEDSGESLADLRKEFLADIDPDAVNEDSINTFRLFFNGFVSAINFEEIDFENGDVFSSVFKIIGVALLTILKLGILISVLFIFPLSMLIALIKLAVSLSAAENKKKPILKRCSAAIIWIGVLLTAVVICGAKFTAMGIILLIAAAIAVAANVAVSRLKSCTKDQFKYLNIMQGTSLVAIVGIVLFAVFFANADLISFYTSGDVMSQITKSAYDSASTPEDALKKVGIGLAVLAIMGSATIIVLKSVFKNAMKLVTHAACMRKGGKTAAYSIGIAGIILFVANKVVMSMYDVSLPSSQNGAMTGVLIASIVVLAAAIAASVLNSVFIPEFTAAQAAELTSGVATEDDEDEKDEKAEEKSEEE